jgi:hypothetical protein
MIEFFISLSWTLVAQLEEDTFAASVYVSKCRYTQCLTKSPRMYRYHHYTCIKD